MQTPTSPLVADEVLSFSGWSVCQVSRMWCAEVSAFHSWKLVPHSPCSRIERPEEWVDTDYNRELWEQSQTKDSWLRCETQASPTPSVILPPFRGSQTTGMLKWEYQVTVHSFFQTALCTTFWFSICTCVLTGLMSTLPIPLHGVTDWDRTHT